MTPPYQHVRLTNLCPRYLSDVFSARGREMKIKPHCLFCKLAGEGVPHYLLGPRFPPCSRHKSTVLCHFTLALTQTEVQASSIPSRHLKSGESRHAERIMRPVYSIKGRELPRANAIIGREIDSVCECGRNNRQREESNFDCSIRLSAHIDDVTAVMDGYQDAGQGFQRKLHITDPSVSAFFPPNPRLKAFQRDKNRVINV
ncbi:hypothetical protein J6590_029494 [Homalodisca vitripennis]|nr:hypothetical protein J6590_029494 [Homalodisca vitripennis]